MEKAHLVAQPFQLIAQQRREAYQLSGSGGRDNESGLPLHPLADKECHWGTLCFKKRERH